MKKLTVLIATAICCCAIASAASIASKDKEQGRSLARIDATLKSYLGNPLTGLVYAASLAIGAISILSMYESPLSPLPVPSLPKPPVGRFPPENPIWPPVAKQPVKLRHSSPYAASNVNPIYSLAPSKVASQEENSWGSEGQNLVQNYHNFLQSQGGQQILAAAAAAANSGAPSAGGSRRQDQLQAAHLQSYINQMSKVPSIRLKPNGQLADSSVPVSHSSAASHPVKHSTSSSVSEVNSSLPSPSSSSSLSPSLSSSSTSSVSSASSSSSAAAAPALPADSMADYSAAAAAA